MSSSDDEMSSTWVPLAERPEWQDVQPIAQPDSLSPVVAIKYTRQVREVFSYFRAIRAATELSSRALYLTQEVIYLNSADYTAWAYRWQCLESMGDLDNEMVFINEMASRSPKNYQLWNHRRRFAFKRGASHAQERMQKNYHAWAHRQAIVRRFGLWQQELDAVDELLHEDIRNNSAWNQRFFIISESLNGSPDLDRVASEFEFVEQKITDCPHNESSWNYLRGLLSLPYVKQQPVLDQMAKVSLQVLRTTPSCPPAMTLLGDIHMMYVHKRSVRQHSHHILQELQHADALRTSFWKAQMQHLAHIEHDSL